MMRSLTPKKTFLTFPRLAAAEKRVRSSFPDPLSTTKNQDPSTPPRSAAPVGMTKWVLPIANPLTTIVSGILLLFLFTTLSFSQSVPTNWTEAARELARQIAEKVGTPSNVSLTVKSVSELSRSDEGTIKYAVESQLSAAGMRIVKPEQSVADIKLNLSRNIEGWLWVAELRHGNNSEVLLIPVVTREGGALTGVLSAVTLHKTLIWAQPDATQVLDVAALGAGPNPNSLLVLDSSMVSLYRMQSLHWELQQAQPIPRSRPWPRDLRGRIMMGHDRKFEVYLPAMKCTGSADSGLTMECHQSDDPWPLTASSDGPRGFFSSRNFFTAAVNAGGGTVMPFFSVFPVTSTNNPLLYAQVNDSLGYGSDPRNGALAATVGSDIAGIKSSCGTGWQQLETAAGDYTQPDSIKAGDTSGGTTIFTAPVDFPGPVTALWTATDASTAIAVSKNLSTGRYEAYSISVNCR